MLTQSSSSKTSIQEFADVDFGMVKIKRIRRPIITYQISINGSLTIYAPRIVNVSALQKFLDDNRMHIKANLSRIKANHSYSNGDKIGHSHTLQIKPGVRWGSRVTEHTITVTHPSDAMDSVIQQHVRDAVEKCLKTEAYSYLRRRLYQLAIEHDFTIDINKFRISHAKTRWGSRSSNGTISLNIMLMTLPDELCDYVILHELNHIKHMDHSAAFWSDLELICPNAKAKRDKLKHYSPYL